MADPVHRLTAAVRRAPGRVALVSLAITTVLALPAVLLPPSAPGLLPAAPLAEGLAGDTTLRDAAAAFADSTPVEVRITVRGDDVVSPDGLATVRAIAAELRRDLPPTWLLDTPGQPAVTSWLTPVEDALVADGRAASTPDAAELDELARSARELLPPWARASYDALRGAEDPVSAPVGEILLRLNRVAVGSADDDPATAELAAVTAVLESVAGVPTPLAARVEDARLAPPPAAPSVPLLIAALAAVAAMVAAATATARGRLEARTTIAVITTMPVLATCVAAVGVTAGVTVALGPTGWRLLTRVAAPAWPLPVLVVAITMLLCHDHTLRRGTVRAGLTGTVLLVGAAVATPVPVVRELAVVAAIGVLTSLALTATLHAALRRLVARDVDDHRGRRTRARPRSKARPGGREAATSASRRWPAQLALVAIGIAAAVAAATPRTVLLDEVDDDEVVVVLLDGPITSVAALATTLDVERAIELVPGATSSGLLHPLRAAVDLAVDPSGTGTPALDSAFPGDPGRLTVAGLTATDGGMDLETLAVDDDRDVAEVYRSLAVASAMARAAVAPGEGGGPGTVRLLVRGADVATVRQAVASAVGGDADAEELAAGALRVRVTSPAAVAIATTDRLATIQGVGTVATVVATVVLLVLGAGRRRRGRAALLGLPLAAVVLVAAAGQRVLVGPGDAVSGLVGPLAGAVAAVIGLRLWTPEPDAASVAIAWRRATPAALGVFAGAGVLTVMAGDGTASLAVLLAVVAVLAPPAVLLAAPATRAPRVAPTVPAPAAPASPEPSVPSVPDVPDVPAPAPAAPTTPVRDEPAPMAAPVLVRESSAASGPPPVPPRRAVARPAGRPTPPAGLALPDRPTPVPRTADPTGPAPAVAASTGADRAATELRDAKARADALLALLAQLGATAADTAAAAPLAAPPTTDGPTTSRTAEPRPAPVARTTTTVRRTVRRPTTAVTPATTARPPAPPPRPMPRATVPAEDELARAKRQADALLEALGGTAAQAPSIPTRRPPSRPATTAVDDDAPPWLPPGARRPSSATTSPRATSAGGPFPATTGRTVAPAADRRDGDTTGRGPVAGTTDGTPSRPARTRPRPATPPAPPDDAPIGARRIVARVDAAPARRDDPAGGPRIRLSPTPPEDRP